MGRRNTLLLLLTAQTIYAPLTDTFYKPSERALSVFKDASRRQAALDTDKARLEVSKLLLKFVYVIIAKSWPIVCETRISFTEDAQYTWILQ